MELVGNITRSVGACEEFIKGEMMKNQDSAPCDFHGYMERVGRPETKDEQQLKATYHADIGNLLQAAYGREFTKQEAGKCKTKFPDGMSWYKTLREEQKVAVDNYIKSVYGVE